MLIKPDQPRPLQPPPPVWQWEMGQPPPRATPLARVEIETGEGAFDDEAAREVLQREVKTMTTTFETAPCGLCGANISVPTSPAAFRCPECGAFGEVTDEQEQAEYALAEKIGRDAAQDRDGVVEVAE